MVGGGPDPNHVLVLIPSEGQALERVVLQPADRLCVGRSSRCEVRLPNESRLVSRLHASLSHRGGVWYVTDESRRGTWLQGERLQPGEPRSIPHGAIVRFGDCEYLVHTHLDDDSLGPEGTYTLSSQVVQLATIDAARVLQSAFELPELLAKAIDESAIYSVACDYLVRALAPAIATAYVAVIAPNEPLSVLGRAERGSISPAARELGKPMVSRRILVRLHESPESVVFMQRSPGDAALSITVSGAPQALGAALLDSHASGRDVILYVIGDVVLTQGDRLVAQYLRLVSTLVRQHLLTRRQAHLTKYFSPSVVQLILDRDPATDIEAEPSVATATSFFFDVRGSSLPLEAADEELSKLYQDLRRVLSIVTEAVFEAGGTIIDYAGDGVFAVWGVPLAQADHADRAVGCALTVVKRLRDTRFLKLKPSASLCGIGIATGQVLVGPVGSSVVFKYGVFGPSVSAAQRLANLTKHEALDRPILMSADVMRQLDVHRGCARRVGEVQLRGMGSQVEVYEASFIIPAVAGPAPQAPRLPTSEEPRDQTE